MNQIEKIARDCCHDIENRSDDCDMVMHAKVMKALAQVRAPLVAKIRYWAMSLPEHPKWKWLRDEMLECDHQQPSACTGGEWQQALDQSRESNEEIARLVQRIRELEQKLLCEK